MRKWMTIAVLPLYGVAGGAASAHAFTLTGACTAPEAATARGDLTASVQYGRYTVVDVDPRAGVLVLRAQSGTVYALPCRARTRVTSSEGPRGGLATLNAGDTVSITGPGVVRLLRQAWEDLGAPEL